MILIEGSGLGAHILNTILHLPPHILPSPQFFSSVSLTHMHYHFQALIQYLPGYSRNHRSPLGSSVPSNPFIFPLPKESSEKVEKEEEEEKTRRKLLCIKLSRTVHHCQDKFSTCLASSFTLTSFQLLKAPSSNLGQGFVFIRAVLFPCNFCPNPFLPDKPPRTKFWGVLQYIKDFSIFEFFHNL